MVSRLACALSTAFSSFTASILVRNQAGFGVLSGLLRALCGVMLPLDIHIFLTFACIPDSRRRFINPAKPLPTFLKDPYWKRNLLELLATNYEGCLHADEGFLSKGRSKVRCRFLFGHTWMP